MKNILLAAVILFAAVSVNAQTSKELMGKWKLVSYKNSAGEDKDLKTISKTGELYQIFEGDNKFKSIADNQTSKGSWELSEDNKTLTIHAGTAKASFEIEYFDGSKRIISSKYGTFEYRKVTK
ncbi:MAG TPA: hypothetical protein VFV68_04650 [Agriterribacter sp.]|nr:hypothetical protein [Agriterribacter sp.]